MIRTVVNVLGVLFILAGLAGFASHHMMDMNLSTTHNIIHLITGVLALWFGLKGTDRGVRNFARTVGVIYGLLGLIGFFFGPDTLTLKSLSGLAESHVWKLIPGHLELGTADDVVHLVAGIIFLIVGFIPRSAELRAERAATETKEKVTPR